MKRFRRIIASLTAAAMLSSFGLYSVQAEGEPEAVMQTVQYGAGELTGGYEYTGDAAEGTSEYKWYIADTLFGEYEPIDGETAKTLALLSDYTGKYIRFSVVPVDESGAKGEEVISDPVKIEAGSTEAFEDGSMPSAVDISKCQGGTVELVEDTTDSGNNALRLDRTDASAGMSIFVYELPETTGNVIAVDADVMASSNISSSVAWDMMYMCQTDTAPDWHAFKVVRVGSNLAIVGSSENWNLTDKFTADEWHHIRLVIDKSNNTILQLYFDDELVCENMGFRFNGEFNGFFSYLSGAATGTGYYDNITVTEAKDYTGLSEADAELIDIGDTTAIQSDITLPIIGEQNGSEIVWTSSDESVIAPDGTVTRPSAEDGDKEVTLTAHVINGNNYKIREFTVTVKSESTSQGSAPSAAVNIVD